MNLDRLRPRRSAERDPSEVSGPYQIILSIVSSLLAQSNSHRVLEPHVGELFIEAINELTREFVVDVILYQYVGYLYNIVTFCAPVFLQGSLVQRFARGPLCAQHS